MRLSGVVKDNTVVPREVTRGEARAGERAKMQVIFGECALEVGDAPTREAAVAKEETCARTKRTRGEGGQGDENGT